MRCIMSDYRLYHVPIPEMHLSTNVFVARHNFAKLLKQCDAVGLLPVPELGILRTEYPMQVIEMPTKVYRFHRTKPAIASSGQSSSPTALSPNIASMKVSAFVVVITGPHPDR